MTEWKNFDTLSSYKELQNAKKVDLASVMTGDNGAKRVKNYCVPMAAGMTYNYAAKQVDEEIISLLVKLAKEAQQAPVQAASPETPPNQNDPPGFQNLPSWAQDMLRRTGGITNDQFTAPNSIQFDANRNGTNSSGIPPFSGGRQRPPAGTGRQITWTAPGAIPAAASAPQAGSPPMVFRERENSQENQSLQNRTMDEREIRKTADKVYRLIEERLRKELRRGGK